MLTQQYYVYFLTNNSNHVLYVGVTNDLKRRVYEHRNDLVDGFSRKYQTHKLVYYEVTQDVMSAISREKQIKAGSRAKKDILVGAFNPKWEDLYSRII